MGSKWMKLEDIVECMINADGTHMSKYAEAKRGLCNLRKQEGDEIFLPKLNKWILELLHPIQAKAPSSVLEVLLLLDLAAAEAVFYCHDDVMLNFPPVLMAAVSD
jgi:hypothetical protein